MSEDALPLILTVDDKPLNQQLVEGILDEKEYRLISANSGLEALKLAVSERPDLILLDIMMPEMDGIEVCERLKRAPDFNIRNIPIIFLTADNQRETLVRAFNAGGVDYVTKPFNPVELVARVKTHLRLRQAMDEIRTLKGIIPICAECKKVRNDQGYWEKVEDYITMHSEAQCSHGLCDECMKKYVPDSDDQNAILDKLSDN